MVCGASSSSHISSTPPGGAPAGRPPSLPVPSPDDLWINTQSTEKNVSHLLLPPSQVATRWCSMKEHSIASATPSIDGGESLLKL